ncbi:MAG: SDR family oxidoreductase [Hyphomicrobiaceae bacterium]|jgi:NAD(P)-dependent dehydrogenase (short-subunit alcohol dehydrogenase family)
MDQRVTLVTGVSKGIGKAVAEDMTARGHHVVGMSRSPPGDWFKGTFVAVDFADAAATQDALASVVKEHRITGLVNNAGVSNAKRAEDVTLEDIDKVMGVNFRALVQCIQAVLPGMRQGGYGRIVNIGSRAALGREARIVYGGSKAAVASMTRSLALEVASEGITVNCVAPGPVETELFQVNHPHGSAARQKIAGAIPMQRIGTTKEVAAACAYFLSEDAAYTTGQVLYVCGALSVGQALM